MKDIRVKVNQIELQVRDYEHTGNAIIFLHFSGANLMMWQRALPYFAEQYRPVLVDLRGHGKSDKPEGGYHIDQMAEDVIGVMDQLELERAHVIGSSMGAEVGLGIAANHPDRVIALVCEGALSSEYGPYGTWEGSEAEYEADVAHQLEEMRSAPVTFYPSLDALMARRQQIFEECGWWNEFIEALERYGALPVADGRYSKGFPRYAQLVYMENYFRCRFEDYYRRVKCPLLMMPGEDLLKNEREKAAMLGLSKLAAQAQIVEVPGWDHPYGWLLDPEGACQAILNFLSGK